MNISVIGLGKLGSVLAAVLADAGHSVWGIDVNADAVDAINTGRAPVDETGLQDLIDRIPRRLLTATQDYDEAIRDSDVSMIVVPTPSGRDDKFETDYVKTALVSIAHNLPDKFHTVVVCSTVMPGASDQELIPTLETASGRKVGDTIGYAYNPEFIALGSVIHDMQNPDVVLLGAQDYKTCSTMRSLVKSYVKSSPKIHEMRYVEAELAKIAVNTYVTMKISYANTIAELSEKLGGCDAANVLKAVGGDSRIGRSYLSPGAAFGGPCFPRDNRAFAALAGDLNVDAPLAIATDTVNRRTTARMSALLREFDSVAVLGMSYKPNTGVSEEAMGLAVAKSLSYAGVNVRVHDPHATPKLPFHIKQYATIEEAIEGANAVLIATPWPEYKKVDFKGARVLDVWGCVEPQADLRVVGRHCWWWT